MTDTKLFFTKLKLNDITFEEITVGHTEKFTRLVDNELVSKFAEISGDYSPLHVDSEYAKQTEFGYCQAHGAIFNAFISGLIGMRLPGKHALCVYTQNEFRNPLTVGEIVNVKGTVTHKYNALRLIDIKTEIRDTKGILLASGLAKVKVRTD